MGKKKSKNNSTEAASRAPANALTTTSTIVADPKLGYRIRVLLHDFPTLPKILVQRSASTLQSTNTISVLHILMRDKLRWSKQRL
ncbi:uncharacterized protein FOBCDRAFT_215380 [Fusarium oxysporum Fo47]|uniref:uncharacterized protein n=1 Tax=Fusarium oxysporum Fo47 TaxID=660027 RepID=UPI002869D06E|nr:uncharacterized protein FOBCDRAFT_215380 [Fusarium oxysporum Fo47]WJG34754.1 hypothetical protein FOBCDRAFT_215380 [Fusarium oxysporum Fo47]